MERTSKFGSRAAEPFLTISSFPHLTLIMEPPPRYGRSFVESAVVSQWNLTLDPRLIWAALTQHAPSRSLLSDETKLAHAQYVAAVAATAPEDGRTVDEWVRLYVYAIGVLPLFDPSSIPRRLIVDRSTGRCFLVRALAHPDDRISRAAAHALQRIFIGHMDLRAPLFRSLLALLSRVPEHDVAVRATTLAHFCQLVDIWITELNTMDPFKLTSAAMLEPVEPYLTKLEAEAFIAMGHSHASVRLPAVELLAQARRLGEALETSYVRMADLISGMTQALERDSEAQRRVDDLKLDERAMRQRQRTARRVQHAAVASQPTADGRRKHVSCADNAPPPRFGRFGLARSLVAHREAGWLSRHSGHGVQSHYSSRPRSSHASATPRSLASDVAHPNAIDNADEELADVSSVLQSDSKAAHQARHQHKTRTRVISVIDDTWDGILSSAIENVLINAGDASLSAAAFTLPEHLSLRAAARSSRSFLWTSLLTSSIHAALDQDCVGFARNMRRALRRRIARLPQLNRMHTSRPDSLVSVLHINWGAMVLAATGRPRHLVEGSPISIRHLEAGIKKLQDKVQTSLNRRKRQLAVMLCMTHHLSPCLKWSIYLALTT